MVFRKGGHVSLFHLFFFVCFDEPTKKDRMNKKDKIRIIKEEHEDVQKSSCVLDDDFGIIIIIVRLYKGR